MPRIKHQSMTQLYSEMRSESHVCGEHNDCSVLAVAAVCGVSYEQARDALKAQGRKDKKGAMTHAILGAVRHFGKSHTSVWKGEFIKRYPSSHQILKSVTSHHPDRFSKAWTDGNTYLLFTNRHVLAVTNGVVHDWSRNRALRVNLIYRIF